MASLVISDNEESNAKCFHDDHSQSSADASIVRMSNVPGTSHTGEMRKQTVGKSIVSYFSPSVDMSWFCQSCCSVIPNFEFQIIFWFFVLDVTSVSVIWSLFLAFEYLLRDLL